MSEPDQSGTNENPNERLVLFSDAVIAITITLMVLEIRLPEGFGEFSDAELWSALLGLWPRFLAYVISFAVIAVFWMNHRAKFDRIGKSDRGITWLNFLFLMTIGLPPFTTSIIAENPGTVGTSIYAAVIVLSGAALSLIWLYAWQRGMIRPEVPEVERRRLLFSALSSGAVFAISIPLSFAHPDAAKYFWLTLIPLNLWNRGVLPRLRRRRG
jgi:uncharacterized membrane protein